jgi:hypothetical protein
MPSKDSNQRKEVNIGDSIKETLFLFGEGNPGGLCVLMELMQDKERGFIDVLSLDDMNIRGTQIWIGYKGHCNEDLEVFRKAIRERSREMVDTINEEGLRGNHEHMAVTGGASHSGNRKMFANE